MSFIKEFSVIAFGLILIPSSLSGQIIVVNGEGDGGETTSAQNPADIAMDYFFGEASLRSIRLPCKDEQYKQCELQCGSNNKCISGNCLCQNQELKEKSKMSKNKIKIMLTDLDHLIEMLSAHLDDDEKSKENTEEEEELIEEETHPALRHHIAHFCTNLDVARQCIRKCMKVGKPAFCGKDHSCYCGHKYSPHDKDKPVDPDDIYAQFRDLYEKYFGKEGGHIVELAGHQ